MNNIFSEKKHVILAPMAGVGDYPFRATVRKFGSHVLFAEMIASEALIRNHKDTIKLASYLPDEQPVVMQIMGADPKSMSEAAKIVEQNGYPWIDINMGCPVKKIVSNNSGCALMKDLKLAQSIIRESVNAVKANVSVKMRLGWDNSSLNVMELAKIAQEEGASSVTIHGRTKSQMYSGISDWEMIKDVKNALSIPVIGNGDINSGEVAKNRINETNVDAIMVGRAMMGKPWLLSQISHFLETGEELPNPDIETIKNTMLFHLEEIKKYYGERNGAMIARKHMSWYAIGTKGAREFRGGINKTTNTDEIKQVIENFFAALYS